MYHSNGSTPKRDSRRQNGNCWNADVSSASEADYIEANARASGRVVSDPARAIIMVDACYDAFEGQLETGSFLRIGMASGTPARIFQDADGVRLEGLWRSGHLAITPPRSKVETRITPLRMLGLAIDLCRLPGCAACATIDHDLYAHAARGFHHDALMTSVLTALWHEADVHGASTAFFEHGVALLLGRLHEKTPSFVSCRTVHRLSPTRFSRVAELIECQLGGDLSVGEMAREAGLDPSGFTRAFRATTGTTPYAYLTIRRMERARLLLADGESVAQVATATGYANAAKFAAAFRRVTGMSPSQWRRDF